VLDILPDAHDLSCRAEVFLDSFPWRDGGGGVSFAQEVPAQEPCQVLECSQGLVAAYRGGDEAQVMRYRGVIDEGVGDHGEVMCRCGGMGRRGRLVFVWCVLCVGSCRDSAGG
jgi:hypothetical protein